MYVCMHVCMYVCISVWIYIATFENIAIIFNSEIKRKKKISKKG